MTARNVQALARQNGMPWTIAKGFDTFTPVSGLISKEYIPDTSDVHLALSVNALFIALLSDHGQ